jgi:hypothetical protein
VQPLHDGYVHVPSDGDDDTWLCVNLGALLGQTPGVQGGSEAGAGAGAGVVGRKPGARGGMKPGPGTARQPSAPATGEQ